MRNSRNKSAGCDALYVAWKLKGEGAWALQRLLTRGAERRLYRLLSWMVAQGEARALLVPAAPLDEIAGALSAPFASTVATRWVEGKNNCAAVKREIERAPVELGLTSRPEEWPLSSAWL